MTVFNKILWPTDFSPLAREALPTVNEMARRFSAAVTVVHALEPPPPTTAVGAPEVVPMDLEGYRRETREKAEKALTELTESALDPTLERRWELLDGVPARAVAAYARDHGVDLIILCSHGESGLARLFFGSFAEKLMRNASCPMLVVPAPERETE